MHSTTRTYDCQIDLPLQLRGAFMQAYKDHVRAVLDKHADSVFGAGTTSDGVGLRGFDFEYTKGRVHGTIAVRSVSGDQELSLFIFVHEHKSQP
jgi:hypothetical protein